MGGSEFLIHSWHVCRLQSGEIGLTLPPPPPSFPRPVLKQLQREERRVLGIGSGTGSGSITSSGPKPARSSGSGSGSGGLLRGGSPAAMAAAGVSSNHNIGASSNNDGSLTARMLSHLKPRRAA